MSSNTRKTTLTKAICVRSTVIVVCLAMMLGFASTGYGDVILGNFENADSNDGWVPGSNDPCAILVPDCNIGVTLGHGSLKLTPGTAGAYYGLGWATTESSQVLNLTDANLQFDLTMVASEWSNGAWTQVGDKIAVNSNGPSGWKEYGPASTSLLAYSFIDRDTGLPTDRWWGPWEGDANKTYSYDISDYDATNATWMQIYISVQDGNLIGGGHFYFDNIRLVTPNMVISKCTVTAGKTQASSDTDYSNMADAFTASGTFVPPDFNTFKDANAVVVTITSTTDDYPYTETLSDFSPTAVNSKHKYTHTGKLVKGQEGKITSLTLDFRKGKFAIAAKNIDLTGLASPLELTLAMGSSELIGHANELIINGPTKTIPTRLMRMYKDTLIVTPGKTKVKSSAKASSDSLSVTGEIAVKDINTTQPNLNNEQVVITWGDQNDANNVQTFTIPTNSFKIPTTGHLYKLNKNIEPNVAPVADSNTIVSGTIDLDKCTFALSITKADINTVPSGLAKFGIAFGDFNEVADVTLP
ncbi:MAG: hypothetical protein WBL85_06395 [Sedimentisphaerales bacterium]